mmetsp:Transcript_24560/g.43592  ORF Transcript_24560/g.43592 Transcript_24560/m.43592 type:complete len:110 (-) Transcript_24560:299-628(-)|eukprot:CAMPEP_0197521508 /NCGR_PEP_ID=MMETSP1318-20131121/6781_1 /TAXON_ID=552666 /ORGANISM="Partenskyella glossopodia, Strain RCC365" /LENGTH=109 /DNA_ID=CAMNT_0043073531 /DNA_START=34 /DNA_END=363 /DNA_ORIENTATION=+
MRIIGAYMLAYLGGNANPDAAAVTSILDSIGEKPDEERLKLFMSQVEGKDIADVIEAGSKKLGAVPSGGGGGGGAGGADGGDGEAKKEEKKEEEEEDGGFDFSDDDDDE